jgi:hypothetical protein
VHGRTDAILHELCAATAADRPPLEVSLDSLELHGTTADGATFHRVGFALAAGGVGNRFFDMYDQDPNPGRAAMIRVIVRTIGDSASPNAFLDNRTVSVTRPSCSGRHAPES